MRQGLRRASPRSPGRRVIGSIAVPVCEAVLAHRDMLPQGVVIPMPDLARFRAASDKQGILALAHQADFGVPKTVVLESAASSIGARDISFPAVLKPHRSVVGSGEATRKVAVVPVADAAAARAALSAFPAAAFPILLQEEIRGVGEGVFALRWNGRMIAVFAHRRLREKPPSGGVSVYRESIAPAPDLIEPATRLLERLQWQGVAMIECKRDESSGRPVVMEINGRFWGSLQLAIDAGVDFPMLLVRCAIGESVSPRSAGYAVGVRSRWFWGDVDHLYLQLKRPVGVSRLGAVAAFLRPHLGRNERTEVWRWNDPVPFLVESLRWLGVLR